MKPASGKTKGVLVTFGLAVAALGYLCFGFLPGQFRLSQSRHELQEKQRFIVEAARLRGKITEAEKQLSSAEDFIADWQRQAPGERDLAPLFSKLLNNAAASGLHIQQLNPQPAVNLQQLRQIPLKITSRGSFVAISTFLERVESMPTPIWIDGLRVASSETGDTLQCELSLTIFMSNPDFSG